MFNLLVSIPVVNNVAEFCSEVSVLLFVVFFGHIVGVRPEEDKVFHHGCFRNELFGCQLSSLTLSDENGGVVSLETGYFFGFSRLTDRVDSLSDAHLSFDGFHFFVKSDDHAGVDTQGEVIQEVVVLAAEERLHISSAVEHRQQTTQRHI